MFTIVKKILTKKSKQSPSLEENTLKNHLAAGVLLLEAAHVDNECTDQEMEHVVLTIKTMFNLDNDCVNELLAEAHRVRDNSVDLWQYTNYMNQNYSKEEKLQVMEDVWRVIHADGQLEKHEDHFAHKLANLLRLTHKELIDLKIKARN
nr:TerB family tellurite resistance protein [Desulfobulbaceae bacterium]